MLQGTGSGVGKSLISAGFCRLLARRGVKVAPFKAQNMALNSGVTRDGHEMGRAQMLQAEAAGVEPDVRMNPILLKPQGRGQSQLIRLGQVVATYAYRDYYQHADENFAVVQHAYDELARGYDLIVLEGAGSPAEINLQRTDLSNMRMAAYAQARVLLVGDIDHGGVFAWLKGTYDFIQPEYRYLLHGCLINKFRGDFALLQPGIRLFEEQVPLPVLGTLPYDAFALDEEDSQHIRSTPRAGAAIRAAVVRLPHMSNFSDFTPLQRLPFVSLEYVERPEDLELPDILILPGSKNTLADLQALRERGWERWIASRLGQFLLIGICGGFQMLGARIADPQGIEGERQIAAGLDILALTTEMAPRKQLVRQQYEGVGAFDGLRIEGYEIHVGRSELQTTRVSDLVRPKGLCVWDAERRVLGTYLHGLFDTGQVTQTILAWTGQPVGKIANHREETLRELDRLADLMEANCDVSRILDGLC